MRDEGTVRNKAVYLAIGVTPDGRKDVLGIWIEQTEGAKFWMRVMSELKNRGVGVNDILIAVVDGLKGFPDAISAVFPETQIQTCIVHLLRNSMDYASWKDRKPVAMALKTVYRAVDAEAAAVALSEFEDGPWGQKIPGHRRGLATPLGRGHPVLRLSAGGASHDLHNQCHREPQQHDPPIGSRPRTLPK